MEVCSHRVFADGGIPKRTRGWVCPARTDSKGGTKKGVQQGSGSAVVVTIAIGYWPRKQLRLSNQCLRNLHYYSSPYLAAYNALREGTHTNAARQVKAKVKMLFMSPKHQRTPQQRQKQGYLNKPR